MPFWFAIGHPTKADAMVDACWTERRVEITMRRANSARGGAMYLSGQGLTWPPELLGVAQITQRVRVSCFRISRGGWV